MTDFNIDPVIDQGFDKFLNESIPFNTEFDFCRRLAAMTMTDMSLECGWRGKTRDLDFSDFSGYYMEYDDNSVTLWYNGVCEGEVIRTEDGIKYDGEYDIIKYANLCRSEENMALAKKEMKQGNEIIYGISYGGNTIVGLNHEETSVMAQICELENKVRFTDPKKIPEAFKDFTENKMSYGPEPVMPQVVLFFYDGNTVRSENTFDPISGRTLEQIQIDQTIFDAFCKEAYKARDKFDELIGIQPEDRPFMYETILFPTNSLRKDVLNLSSKHGTASMYFFAVRNGRLAVYDDFQFNRPLGKPKRTFKSIEDAVKDIEDYLARPKVISCAKKEYEAYVKERNMAQKEKSGIKL